MKSLDGKPPRLAVSVASLAEAWIEIFWVPADGMVPMVASLAEAWIEIGRRRCIIIRTGVASLAEAWIEIIGLYSRCSVASSRLPRGGVD